METTHIAGADGTKIGYRQLGNGPGVIVLHGSMCSGYYHLQLAEALAAGKVTAALATAMKGAQLGPTFVNALPHWLLTAMTAGMANRTPPGDYIPFAALAAPLQHEGHEITQMSGSLEILTRVRAQVLLLGGGKSSRLIRNAVQRVQQALPDSERVELPGLDHSAAWNKQVRGNPEPIAAELRKFFGAAR